MAHVIPEGNTYVTTDQMGSLRSFDQRNGGARAITPDSQYAINDQGGKLAGYYLPNDVYSQYITQNAQNNKYGSQPARGAQIVDYGTVNPYAIQPALPAPTTPQGALPSPGAAAPATPATVANSPFAAAANPVQKVLAQPMSVADYATYGQRPEVSFFNQPFNSQIQANGASIVPTGTQASSGASTDLTSQLRSILGL